jgi:hypothetical protein
MGIVYCKLQEAHDVLHNFSENFQFQSEICSVLFLPSPCINS